MKNVFIVACQGENDPWAFEELVRNFWIYTESFGYEALPELLKQFENDEAKRKIVERLVEESKKQVETIRF